MNELIKDYEKAINYIVLIENYKDDEVMKYHYLRKLYQLHETRIIYNQSTIWTKLKESENNLNKEL